LLTASGLTVEDVYRVAVEHAPLDVAPEVYERLRAGRDVVERVLAGDTLVYGLNTHLGHMRDEPVSREVIMQYQVMMVVGHAGGIGRPLPDEDVRALMLARIAGMARGGSGAHPDALRTLVAMLNAGVHPVVPEVGSVGASDLMHMAAVAMVAIGRGEARFRGETLPGAEALEQAGIRPYVMEPKDGLALISANGASIGLGALAVLEAERVAALADTAGALALEVIGGNPSPFEAVAAAAKPVLGQIAAAAHLRALLQGSYLYDPATRLSVQDPLSFRVMPQVHGALREQIGRARQSVELELNAMDDNPLVSVEEDRMLSTGNFHPMVLALDFDALRVGLAHVGMLSERRMNKLLALRFRDPQAFFEAIDDPQRRPSGGLLSYAAAAVLSELKHLAAPATLECPPLDLDVEDHATLAPTTVMLTRRAIGQLETILSIEALLAVNTLDSWPELPRLGAGTRAAYELVQDVLDGARRGASGADVAEAVRQALTRWEGLAVT
jgi:histidine ammonia-lyase